MTTIDEQISIIQSKIQTLRTLDPEKTIFGSDSHKYVLNPTKTEHELREFEDTHQIRLPADYRAFLLHVGNGGMGPWYGLAKVENGVYVDFLGRRDDEELLNLSAPFRFTEAWDLDFDQHDYEKSGPFDDVYFDPKWIDGALQICHYGCGHIFLLVVSGAEYGHIWFDNRVSDGGLNPDLSWGQQGRTQFLDWYELWLDKSIQEVT